MAVMVIFFMKKTHNSTKIIQMLVAFIEKVGLCFSRKNLWASTCTDKDLCAYTRHGYEMGVYTSG